MAKGGYIADLSTKKQTPANISRQETAKSVIMTLIKSESVFVQMV